MGRLKRAAMWISRVGIVTILLCALFASVLPIQAASVWVSPTSFNDPNNVWTTEAKAYDGNINTFADQSLSGKFLELNIAALSCSKIRYMGIDGIDDGGTVDIDLYYNGEWNHLYDGAQARGWVTIEIGSVQSVSKARIAFSAPLFGSAFLWEFEFGFLDSTMAGTPSWTLLVGIASAFGVTVFVGILVLLGSNLTFASVLLALVAALVGVMGMVTITQIIMGLH